MQRSQSLGKKELMKKTVSTAGRHGRRPSDKSLKEVSKKRQKQHAERAEKLAPDFDVHSLFTSDHDVRDMRRKYVSEKGLEFTHCFHMAILNYEAGEWTIA